MDINHNTKIALLLTGKTTSSMLCFPYIYESFLNTELNVDVFIHTWQKDRIVQLYNPKKYTIDKTPTDYIIQHYLNNLILPKDISIEGHIVNNILQFYTNKMGFDLIPSDYEFVIRCRFDVIFQNKLNLTQILIDIKNGKYDVFCPDEIFNFGGYQDRIYIGKYDAIKHAFDVLKDLNSIIHKLKRWHPESFLKEKWQSSNIKVFQPEINHRLVRNVVLETNWPENPYNYLNL